MLRVLQRCGPSPTGPRSQDLKNARQGLRLHRRSSWITVGAAGGFEPGPRTLGLRRARTWQRRVRGGRVGSAGAPGDAAQPSSRYSSSSAPPNLSASSRCSGSRAAPRGILWTEGAMLRFRRTEGSSRTPTRRTAQAPAHTAALLVRRRRSGNEHALQESEGVAHRLAPWSACAGEKRGPACCAGLPVWR